MKVKDMFKVVNIKIDHIKGLSRKEIIIEARYEIGNQWKMLVKLNIKDDLTVSSISFTDVSTDYLTGYFELGVGSNGGITRALNDLIAKINKDIDKEYTFMSNKWEKFSILFREWFTQELKPFLVQEAQHLESLVKD